MWKAVVGITLLLGIAVAALLVIDSGVLLIRGENVSFVSGEATIAGTLALPRSGSPPFPAAVIVHGSGPVARRDVKGYARRLVPEGLAVLIYDKRGVGKSTGSYSLIGVPESEEKLGQLADDVAAAADLLARRADIDRSRIGLIGGSQAGWIMPLAASRSDHVSFVVAVSGPAVTYGQEVHFSQLTGEDAGPYGDLSEQEIARRMAVFSGPHGYDPTPVLEALSAPSLWLLGGKDRSVPTELSVNNLERIMAIRPGVFDIRVFPNGNHDLRHSTTGRRLDYWTAIRAWLREQRIIGEH